MQALTFARVRLRLEGELDCVSRQLFAWDHRCVFARSRILLLVGDVPVVVSFLHVVAAHAERAPFALLKIILEYVVPGVVVARRGVTGDRSGCKEIKLSTLFISLTLFGT